MLFIVHFEKMQWRFCIIHLRLIFFLLMLIRCQPLSTPSPLVTPAISPTATIKLEPTAIKDTIETEQEAVFQVCTFDQYSLSMLQMNDLIGYDLHDGLIQNENSLWLVGEKVHPQSEAILLESKDEGKTLRQVYLFQDLSRVLKIREYDNSFWVIGNSKNNEGVLLKSSQPDMTWENILLPIKIRNMVDFIIAPGGAFYITGNLHNKDAILFASVDGGITWQIKSQMPAASIGNAYFNQVATLDKTVVAVGTNGVNGIVAISKDGGGSFELINLNEFTVAKTINLITLEKWYIGGYSQSTENEIPNSVLVETNDSGFSWQKINTPEIGGQIQSLVFLSSSQGLIAMNEIFSFTIEETDIKWEQIMLQPPPIYGRPIHLFYNQDNPFLVYILGIGGSGLYMCKNS